MPEILKYSFADWGIRTIIGHISSKKLFLSYGTGVIIADFYIN